MSEGYILSKGITETGLDFKVYLEGRQWVVEISRDGQILKEQLFDCSQTPVLGIHSDDIAEAKRLVGALAGEAEGGDVAPIAPVNPHEQDAIEFNSRMLKLGLKSHRLDLHRAERGLSRKAAGGVYFLTLPVWLFTVNAVLPDGSAITITDRAAGLSLAAGYIEARACHA